MILQSTSVETPVGTVVLFVRDGALCGLTFDDRALALTRFLERRFGEFTAVATRDPGGLAGRLRAYFSGEIGALDSIPVDPGGTSFQIKIWSALRLVPPGRTVSYSQLARAAGCPAAVRPVAAANARNPVAIVIPCHRVIASDGTLGGYGGGLERKRWLVEHEKAGAAGGLPGQAALPFAAGRV